MIALPALVDDDRTLRDAYGRFPCGVTVMAALRDGTPVGMTACSFVPVSLRPPLVSVCVQTDSRTWPRLQAAPGIGISFLGEKHDRVARKLAAKTGDRFADVSWDVSDNGAIFLHEAAAWLDCTVEKEIPAGDHIIVLLRIWRLAAHEHVNPLVFHGSRFRQLVPLVA